MSEKKNLTIQEASVHLNKQSTYIRALIKKGTLEASQEPVPGRKTGYRLMVTMDSIKRYQEKSKKGTRTRADGKKKYIMFLTENEVLNLQNFGYTVTPAHTKKEVSNG